MGIFCKYFNKISPIGYHSDAIVVSEKVFHFAVLPHGRDTYVIHEMTGHVKGQQLSAPLSLHEALARAHQLFNLKVEALRTAASHSHAVSVMDGLAPALHGFTWQHAREAAATA